MGFIKGALKIRNVNSTACIKEKENISSESFLHNPLAALNDEIRVFGSSSPFLVGLLAQIYPNYRLDFQKKRLQEQEYLLRTEMLISK